MINPGGWIRDIVANPTSEKVYVSIDTDEVVKIDLVTETIVQRVTVSGGPGAMAISPDGNRLFIALNDSNDIAVYSAHGLSFMNLIEVST